MQAFSTRNFGCDNGIDAMQHARRLGLIHMQSHKTDNKLHTVCMQLEHQSRNQVGKCTWSVPNTERNCRRFPSPNQMSYKIQYISPDTHIVDIIEDPHPNSPHHERKHIWPANHNCFICKRCAHPQAVESCFCYPPQPTVSQQANWTSWCRQGADAVIIMRASYVKTKRIS